MTAKQASATAKTKRVFGQRQESAKMFRVGLYARVSTHDQQTLPLQMRTMREYAAKRGWMIAAQIKEVGSGAAERELRERLLAAARRREIDVVLVWRLDRWGRSLVDLVVTLKELAELGVVFVSLTEALDLTTPTGRAMAGLLSVFAAFEHEILRERIRAGISCSARPSMSARKRPRYHLHFTPTSSSRLNQIERWFAEITRKRIRRGTFQSVRELTTAIQDYIRTYNLNPQPFHWVASASRIIRKVNKYKDTSEAGD